MARVIEGEQVMSIVVEHVSQQFQIWRINRGSRVFEVTCHQRGGLAITFSAGDANELESDLNALRTRAVSLEQFEGQLAHKIDGFLAGIEQ
ncbi:MAG: hypothetical protein EBS90_09600 [Betaproteobacteria bacterium]|nr:hypothetical protein [Betaproteobacteria bacterium]